MWSEEYSTDIACHCFPSAHAGVAIPFVFAVIRSKRRAPKDLSIDFLLYDTSLGDISCTAVTASMGASSMPPMPQIR